MVKMSCLNDCLQLCSEQLLYVKNTFMGVHQLISLAIRILSKDVSIGLVRWNFSILLQIDFMGPWVVLWVCEGASTPPQQFLHHWRKLKKKWRSYPRRQRGKIFHLIFEKILKVFQYLFGTMLYLRKSKLVTNVWGCENLNFVSWYNSLIKSQKSKLRH